MCFLETSFNNTDHTVLHENYGDMKHHQERLHEYEETCNMYACEDCWFQGQNVKSLKVHISESHKNSSDENSLEQLGI